MSRAKFVIFSILLAGVSCSRESANQNPPAQQQPAAQPEASAPPAEAPETQPEAATAPAASAPETAEAARKTAATRQSTRPADTAASRSPKGVGGAPISRSDESREGTGAAVGSPADPVSPPTRASNAAPAAPPAPPKPRILVLPAGTKVHVRLNQAMSSESSKSGDSFETTLDEDLEVEGKILAPRGSEVTGKVVRIDQAGRVEGKAGIALTLTEVRTQAGTYPVRTNTLFFEAESTKKQDAAKVGVGAGVGAIIGAIAGGGKGAAVGAAVGGGAGTATVLATRGKPVKFEAEHRFSFVLRDELQVRLPH